MPRVLLILVFVLLVVGGGGAAWWFGLRGESLPFADEMDNEQPVRTSTFVELAPLTFPVMRDGRVAELMTLVISVEVLGESTREAVQQKKPVLRDAMLSELHGLYAHSFMREREDAMSLVKQRLLKAARQVGGEEIRGVYVQAVEERREASQG